MTEVTFAAASDRISFFSHLTDLKNLPEVFIMFEQYCKICFISNFMITGLSSKFM